MHLLMYRVAHSGWIAFNFSEPMRFTSGKEVRLCLAGLSPFLIIAISSFW
jgi:hypothetical protein